MTLTSKRPAADVRLEGVSKRYGTFTAVKPLDLVLPAGKLVTLLGPSGCGKTTLLRLIAGLERVSDGSVSIGGRDVTDLSANARNVSMVFQSYALFPHMSVVQNVAYGLISGGMAKAEANRTALAIIETVGLKDLGERLPSELSGGQQQRVALARALVLEPEVLLFDEPLSNLDARLRRTMREEIRALQQSLGVTVVYVTHDQSEAMAVSDQIIVMREGEIAQSGTPRDLYDAPDDVFVATFMGEANHVRGELTPTTSSAGHLKLGGLRRSIAHAGLPAGPVDVVIRPEAVTLASIVEPGMLAATVRHAIFMGSHAEYVLDTAVGSIFAIERVTERLHAPGNAVGIMLQERGVFALKA